MILLYKYALMRRDFLMLAGLVALIANAAFGQTEVISNGGFESTAIAPWKALGTGTNVLFTQGAHTGNQCLRLGAGNDVHTQVYQTITFPTNLINAVFSFYYNITSTDPVGQPDSYLHVYIADDATLNVLADIGEVANTSTTTGYVKASTNLVTFSGQFKSGMYTGRKVRVYFVVDTDFFFGVYNQFYIDDVSMVIGTTADIAANDYFTNRTPITASGSTMTTKTAYATLESNEPNHAGNTGGHSAWWSWTSPGMGIAAINDTSSDFHTVLAVYTGDSLTNLTRITASQGVTNANGGTSTKVSFKAYPGVQYAIALDGYNSASGNAAINFTFTPDTTVPKVVITSPLAGATVTNSTVIVKGTASDNLAVAAVEYRLENAAGTNDYALAIGTNTWSTTVPNLVPGANTVRVIALDTSSNLSASVTRTFNYAVRTPLNLTVQPGGSVTGATNGQRLNVNYSYRLIAVPKPGFAFAGWTGDIVTNSATLAFIMRTNLALVANFVDIARPNLTITSPTFNQRWSNAVFTAKGKATDNLGVSTIYYQLNGGSWLLGATTNGYANWTAELSPLTPGTNVVQAYAVDAAGHASRTNTAQLLYILSAPLSVTIEGSGTLTPNLGGRLLQISNSYSMTAAPKAGFAFDFWSNDGVTNTHSPVRFTMYSNLALYVHFKDIKPPLDVISFPAVNQRWSNAVITVAGKASDNTGVAGIWYQLNGGGWNPAQSTNQFTNWIAPSLTLSEGTNIVQAFARDAAGNGSMTNSVKFLYVVPPSTDWAPNTLTGRKVQVWPGSVSPLTIAFSASTFSQTDTNSGDDSGLGNYQYTKTSTNTAQLSFVFTQPPTMTNTQSEVQLVFTNAVGGNFTNQNSGSNGTFSVSIASALLPSAWSGHKITASSTGGGGAVLTLSRSSFSIVTTDNNSPQTGTYVAMAASPISAMLIASYTNSASLGLTSCLQLTFTTKSAGHYELHTFDPQGNLLSNNSDAGSFSWQ